ncbi:hypothetical protein DN752_18935 [Echinicola strongylocentroti]|uniref:Uncharacterized protein n=1 Tax=Echinicola strongylocentroti TaxID=1795355 RepID=A0A2Z4ILP5_9BACT|nr:hypothetical protein DN752_18935 [Echinicola strongylocentroti]
MISEAIFLVKGGFTFLMPHPFPTHILPKRCRFLMTALGVPVFQPMVEGVKKGELARVVEQRDPLTFRP